MYMKKSAFKTWKGFSALIVIFCVLVSSCSNFMGGSDLKNELDRKIKISNSVCPEAKVEEPVFQDAGVSKNKKIIISFTKSMNTQTFWQNLSITDSLGNNLKPNFLEPTWSNENKLVEIPANEQNLIDLRGKKYLDIYVTLTRLCEDKDALPIEKAIEHKYRINDTTDNIPPVLSFVKGELLPEYVSDTENELTTELYCGEYTYLTESEICNNNHINSIVDFYVEGSDYGGGEVSAHFVIQRLYDTGGKALYEEPLSKTEKLNQINYDGNYFDTIHLDMTDPQFYQDGMYKITVTVNDGSMDSETSKVYYVIRDTSLANSPGAMIWFMTPGFRQDETMEGAPENDPYKYCLDDFDKIIATKDKIEYFRNRLIFGFILDDVYYISPFANKTIYQQNHDDLKYLFSWGTSLDKLSEPVQLKGTAEADYHYTEKNIEGLAGTATPLYYFLPGSYKDYCDRHKTSDIYLQVTIVDSVGNSNKIVTVIPKQIEFYNYEKVSVDEDTKDMTIRLNYSDLCLETSTDITGLMPIPDKASEIKYRVFYTPIPEDYPQNSYNELPLQRNLMFTLKEEIDKGQRVNFKDKAELVIKNIANPDDAEYPKYPKYLVYIQPDYGLHSTINEIWAGESFGPLYEVVVDVKDLPESSLDAPVIESSLKLESAGNGTGLFNITGKISDYDADIKYVPYVSTGDGNNWINYDAITSEDFSFTIMNPLKAPFSEWTDENKWAGNYFTAYSNLEAAADYKIDVKVKILAIKGNETKFSAEKTIQISAENNDNIAPSLVPKIVSHDSLLSFDGRSFKYGGSDGLVKEDEGHLADTFTYYYTPYNDAWGNNLSVLSDDEILALPEGTGTYETEVEVWDNSANYKIKPVVPVNGLLDGKYMFFAKVSDTKGNSSIMTLGKANINTFKNKLSAEYDPVKNAFNVSFVYDDNKSYERNMLNIQKFNTEWRAQNGDKKELIEVRPIKKNEKLVLSYNTSDYEGGESLSKGLYYRLSLQAFNESTYDGQSKTGVRLKYKMPYNPGMGYDGMQNYDYLPNETEYDMYTEETVSNTVYCYVPAQGENMSNVVTRFFKNSTSPRSNKPYIVNIISSLRNLGNDIDEWERRGKIIKTLQYERDDVTTEFFNDQKAIEIMNESKEIGTRYFVVVVHFANNTSAISNVYTMEGM